MLRVTVFEIFVFRGPKFWIFGNPGVTAPKTGEDLSGTDIYHHRKFHADRCHRRRDICNQTERKTATNIAFHIPLYAQYGG